MGQSNCICNPCTAVQSIKVQSHTKSHHTIHNIFLMTSAGSEQESLHLMLIFTLHRISLPDSCTCIPTPIGLGSALALAPTQLFATAFSNVCVYPFWCRAFLLLVCALSSCPDPSPWRFRFYVVFSATFPTFNIQNATSLNSFQRILETYTWLAMDARGILYLWWCRRSFKKFTRSHVPAEFAIIHITTHWLT